MLDFLLMNSVDVQITGEGFGLGSGVMNWQKPIPVVNPISYAINGPAPTKCIEMKLRSALVVTKLLKSAYGIDYTPGNVPCAYLRKKMTCTFLFKHARKNTFREL